LAKIEQHVTEQGDILTGQSNILDNLQTAVQYQNAQIEEHELQVSVLEQINPVPKVEMQEVAKQDPLPQGASADAKFNCLWAKEHAELRKQLNHWSLEEQYRAEYANDAEKATLDWREYVRWRMMENECDFVSRPWNPWLFLDWSEFGVISQTCTSSLYVVLANTPMFQIGWYKEQFGFLAKDSRIETILKYWPQDEINAMQIFANNYRLLNESDDFKVLAR